MRALPLPCERPAQRPCAGLYARFPSRVHSASSGAAAYGDESERPFRLRGAQLRRSLRSIRAAERFFSGVLHPHLLAVCCPNRFLSGEILSACCHKRGLLEGNERGRFASQRLITPIHSSKLLRAILALPC